MPKPTGYAVICSDGRYELQDDFSWTGPDGTACESAAAAFPAQYGYDNAGVSRAQSPEAAVTKAVAELLAGTPVIGDREPKGQEPLVH